MALKQSSVTITARTSSFIPSACKMIIGKDYTSLEDSRRQLSMLSFEELVFINKAKVMFKVTHDTSGKHVRVMYTPLHPAFI